MILERKIVVFQQFFNPLVYRERAFLFFLYFFSSEKVHEHETGILYMNRDFAPKKKWSKKACFWLLSMNLKIAKILNEVCIFHDFL